MARESDGVASFWSEVQQCGACAAAVGHIHQPCDRMVQAKGGQVRYLNSGDWVENCTALEYHGGSWHIHTQAEVRRDETAEPVTKKDQEIFQELLSEFSIG